MTSKQQTSSSSSSLYGIQRSKQSATSQKDLSSSSTLAFTTHLSSLISKDATSTSQSSSSRGRRSRPSKDSKPDIFAVHNKGALKRAAADEAEDVHGVRQQHQQAHQNSDAVGQVDAATLQRSKRRMEEKAHIYEDLKKGYHLAEGESSDDDDMADGSSDARMRRREKNALVDFDRKWAEQEHNGDDDDDEETRSMVDYEDEFGRTRQGTKAEAAQAARARRSQQQLEGEEGKDASRPARPSNLIHGEAIQSHAFNPDAAMASQMAFLAARRDRSPTPPEQAHYDAEAEVRTRGTGFYKFSADEKTREKEMEELLSTRRETEREREIRGERRAERDRIKEERKRKVQELRSRHHAERFLKGLSVDLG
ncbi:uncharacterized protein TRUGW13939_03924 [Talaromyces rugulosus]|uniref:Uncharacterized protein n=1 Tax=Talaromyces rugulosus TaxID=121627 RepID=A0A7H8QS51_TALRU|nr:uncharacterized protein TRUGW13939_03924 [Talaromyces rugulosus]QKX56817.1 hypothetical protein TRUGW13939_03924 [Talaromyces rugulosus]